MCDFPQEAAGLDAFQKYVEVVRLGGERTRSVTYVNILILAVAIALVRAFVFPSWDFTEFRSATRVTNCISEVLAGKIIANDEDTEKGTKEESFCEDRLMARFGVHLKDVEPSILSFGGFAGKPELVKDVPTLKFVEQTYLNEANNRTNHEFYRIPFFDVELHENDAWVLTGVFGSVSMVLLRAFLKREYLNLRYVVRVIPSNAAKFLILSTQVFATPLKANDDLSWWIRTAMFLALFFLMPILHFALIFQDLFDSTNRGIVFDLLGSKGAVVEQICRLITGFFLIIVAVSCWLTNYKIDREIKFIDMESFPLSDDALTRAPQ